MTIIRVTIHKTQFVLPVRLMIRTLGTQTMIVLRVDSMLDVRIRQLFCGKIIPTPPTKSEQSAHLVQKLRVLSVQIAAVKIRT